MRAGFAQCSAAQFASYVKQELTTTCAKRAAAATNVQPGTGAWAVELPAPEAEAAGDAAPAPAPQGEGAAAAPLAGAGACKDSGEGYSRTAAWVGGFCEAGEAGLAGQAAEGHWLGKGKAAPHAPAPKAF
jgi:hypothetical protein